MQKIEATWRKNGDWKTRYSKLYSSQRVSIPNQEAPSRISFMTNDSTPYISLLMRMRTSRRESLATSDQAPERMTSILSQRSDLCSSHKISISSDDLGGHETLLLEMVRANSQDIQDTVGTKTINLCRDRAKIDDQTNDGYVHGFAMRTTDRSMSRSRFSRVSTRRDMDIPSILAFTTNIAEDPVQLEIPAFPKMNLPVQEEIPRWSIRRAVCPVCSQKWRDRSSVKNIKYSGLRRNSLSELPSVIAPARLRTSITLGYAPRPVLADVVNDSRTVQGGLRNSSASWQLTRARRFRIPKPQIPPPEATAPPSVTAPLAIRDLDDRVHKFLKDENVMLTT